MCVVRVRFYYTWLCTWSGHVHSEFVSEDSLSKSMGKILMYICVGTMEFHMREVCMICKWFAIRILGSIQNDMKIGENCKEKLTEK